MKTTKFIFSFFIIVNSVYINAQLKVFPLGYTIFNNKIEVHSNSNTISDLVDMVSQNPSISNGIDLMWGTFSQPQPYNPGLLSLTSVDGAFFTVRANGRVGIFNNNPSCALEVGTVGTNYEIKVNGSIVLTSDERVKKNIKNIDNSLDKLKLLKGVSYNFIGVKDTTTDENYTTDDKGNNTKPKFKPRNNKDSYGRNYYGFLAQDVQKLFPDLVYKDSAGLLGVDYIGIIPLLVNALSEQEIKIADLETRLSKLETGDNSSPKKVGANTTPEVTNTLTYPVLDQNTPNPFNQSTTIGYYLPTIINTAAIYVYDMNGVQLKSYNITEKGKKNIIINGSEFNAGMYLYALIADGKVIDTKRMILTK